MWYLNSEAHQRVIYIGGQNQEITIGRNADPQVPSFVIADDPSISRKHAVLTIVNNELTLKDLGSRYGTFINVDEKIEPNFAVKLVDEDVTFGKMGSTWKVNSTKFITCTSTLKGENLQQLRQCMNNLSGTLKNDWDSDCKFLTMPAITLTMKVVLALVQGAYIVNVDYWNKCLEAVNRQTSLPDPESFVPQVIESTLNKENVSFSPKIARQQLFSGKTVVFFSKRQYEMYKIVIEKASATPLLLSESKMSKSALCDNNIIVIQYNVTTVSQDTQTQNNVIQDIANYLKSKGKRLITDVEIGLAILYCSTEKYCNPDFSFTTEVVKQIDQSSKSSANKVLVPESQEQSKLSNCKQENILIDESLSTTINDNSTSGKRKTFDDNDMNQANKKVAIGCSKPTNNSCTNKRKADEIIDASLHHEKKVAIDTESSQEGFSFINKGSLSYSEVQSEKSKRLNLTKPQKRKPNNDDDEDDLFQFVPDKSKVPCISKSNLFDIGNVNTTKSENSEDIHSKENSKLSNDVDLSSLRGSKLAELMKNNEKVLSSDSVGTHIKNELVEDLSNLNLGSTIVTIKKELIVKKEPVYITEQCSGVKNFKKFKKVWPIKIQISLVALASS